jgi:hypothetical protein
MTSSRLLALIMVFSPISLLSFGGGQATIPEMQRQTVAIHGWLTDAQFADVYAISRSAPGPSTLIVALIGWQVSGFLGAVVATLAVFVPSSILMFFASAWWQRNEKSMIRMAVETGLRGCCDRTRRRARRTACVGDRRGGLSLTKHDSDQHLRHCWCRRGLLPRPVWRIPLSDLIYLLGVA